jgi:hypothetical protein
MSPSCQGDMAGNMSVDPPGEPDTWVSIRQAARRLGVTRTAIYSRIERGTLQARPNGNRGQLVRLPSDMQATVSTDRGAGTPPDMTPDMSGQHVALQAERDRLAGEVERWRSLAEERALAQARGEVENARRAAELAGKAELVEELRRQMAKLETEVAELRTPWWAKVLAALRHQG